MYFETGCYGRVALGKLPEPVMHKLEALPGEWLEYEPETGTIEVRLCQPSSKPCLPTITSELVRMLAEIPLQFQEAIPGGEFFLHTEQEGQLVRLRVEPGGMLRISWAHPDFTGKNKVAFTGRELLVEPHVQRLNGCVTLTTAAPGRVARDLEALADSYEGLYPEGEFIAVADDEKGQVRVELRDVNLDARLLVERMLSFGQARGRIEVSSFAAAVPEQSARLLLEDDKVFIERPELWETPARSVPVGASK